ncbi:CRISPR-associated protein Cas6 (plasmid) [Deferribacter desulfuricans SSM1]|uniref:CRISPR-associated endoribonuclease n=1 Tax=Deferribacter desulfuricans (strain DSM 14783 / JCM 11476 / NBRC 101012 / SSM1) TaxID=639282 RepID=D3PEQ4_DEFDS|nr:CRISPR-associated endoribonuclease Cas6 [Deferribacter desulfuricans]BAI81696.1 CRISPR-associated protein Cas6 [Deferribacter desulfuricans SSM1]
MRMKIEINSNKNFILLPINHKHIIQGFLYNNLPKPLSDFLHNIGFFYYKRQFKLFTFSNLYSSYFQIITIQDNKKTDKYIKFKTPVTLYIASGINNFINNWNNNFLLSDNLKLGDNTVYIESIEVLPQPEITNKCLINTLSPITVYRTLENKKYHYYNPNDIDFNVLVKNNIKKKYALLTNTIINDFDFNMKNIKYKKIITKYIKKPKINKDFIIEAYDGIFEIETEPEILKTIYDVGLGAKNSQGFGMFSIIKNN